MQSAWARLWIGAGAVAGFATVALAAIAAHALPQRLNEHDLHAVQSGLQMQGWHAAALILTGLLVARGGRVRLANVAGAAFLAGLLLFCGAVYAGALAGVHLGPVAPTGGVLLMAGWLLLAASAVAAEGAP
jgi:uncharacterized membrane protein YgdD (TMEM256/DUF423 family)